MVKKGVKEFSIIINICNFCILMAEKFPDIYRISEKAKADGLGESFYLCLEKTVWFYPKHDFHLEMISMIFDSYWEIGILLNGQKCTLKFQLASLVSLLQAQKIILKFIIKNSEPKNYLRLQGEIINWN